MEGGHRGWEGVRHWPKSKRFGGKSVQGADKPQAPFPLADSPAGAMAIPPLNFPSGWSLPSSGQECGQRTASVCRAARILLTSLRAAASPRRSTAGHLAFLPCSRLLCQAVFALELPVELAGFGADLPRGLRLSLPTLPLPFFSQLSDPHCSPRIPPAQKSSLPGASFISITLPHNKPCASLPLSQSPLPRGSN